MSVAVLVRREALLLLYGLMDSASPVQRKENVDYCPNDAVDKTTECGPSSCQSSLESERFIDQGHRHRFQSMPTTSLYFPGLNATPVASRRQSDTDLDSLEDSFKMAVGIVPTRKLKRGNGNSPRTHSKAHTGAAVSGDMNIPVNTAKRSSFNVPEEVILRDVMYALQAIESRYLYFDAAADRFQITKSVGVPKREWVMCTC